jgi:hypothetical protein
MCGVEFQPVREGHVYHSSACRSRDERNESYFDGRMAEAEGWQNKQCQACRVLVKRPRKFHIHHVFGYPDHSRLVVLCAGCHELVSKLAWRRMELDGYERILAYALMQKQKRPLAVDIEVSSG